jgi:hypothetical protein
MVLNLWSEKSGYEHTLREITEPQPLSNPGTRSDDPEVVIMPMHAPQGTVGLMAVPRKIGCEVRRNGVPLSPGLEVLNHGDQLEIGGGRYWVSRSYAPKEEAYRSRVHGRDLCCFLTRAPLTEETPIIRCPGLPRTPCGALFQAEAWRAVRAANPSFHCPRCGARPTEKQWKPPIRADAHRLDRLMKIAQKWSFDPNALEGGAT